MRTRKQTLIKVAALALFVCVLATGCIGSAAAADNFADAKVVAGEWTIKTDNGNSTFIMALYEDGTGFVGALSDAVAEMNLKAYVPLTWKIADDGKLAIEYTGTGLLGSLSYDKASALLVDEDGVKYARLDPIAGTWYGKSVSSKNGKEVKTTYFIKHDGTGAVNSVYDDGTAEVHAFAWKKSGDKYNLTHVDGCTEEFMLNAAQDKITASDNQASVIDKILFIGSLTVPQILGSWVDEKGSSLTIFNPDNTGVRVSGDDISPLEWKMTGFDTYFVEFTGGALKGYAGRYTFDMASDSLTTTNCVKLIRPQTNVAGLSVFLLPKEKTLAHKIVDEWVTEEVVDGVRQYLVTFIKDDQTGFFATVPANGEFSITKVVPFTWKMSNENAFKVTPQEGTPLFMSFDRATDKITDNLGRIHERQKPVSGVWYGEKTDATSGKSTYSLVLGHNGRGKLTVVNPDKSVTVDKCSWSSLDGKTYTITYMNGNKRTHVLSDDEQSLIEDNGVKFTRQFANAPIFPSIIGPWNRKDSNGRVVFVADGTGFIQGDAGLSNFTWTFNQPGKVIVHHVDGKYKGEDSEWVYDRKARTLTSTKTGYVHDRAA